MAQGKNNWKKKGSTSKEYISQTTSLQPSVPWESLDSFPRQPSGSQEAQFIFIVLNYKIKGL